MRNQTGLTMRECHSKMLAPERPAVSVSFQTLTYRQRFLGGQIEKQ
jgi:hypothetical protein